MAKCASCKAEIDHLIFEEVRTYHGSVELSGSKLTSDIDHVDVEAHYSCPECDDELAVEESVAVSILKGEHNGQA